MPRIKANGLDIEYEEVGSADDPMILLISGYMGQMTKWPDSCKQALADAGRRVVTFDNRDIGLTTATDDPGMEEIVPPPMEALVQGAAAIADVQRANRPSGLARQFAALLAQPRWHDRLGTVTHPTLVLHGSVDRLIHPEAGRDVARRVPGVEFEIIEKWGHDLSEKVVTALLNRIIPFLNRTAQSGPAHAD
ncbi:alpha/beta fold hydrolase [Hyphomonas pacifica]|uniref:alpha/beta fold hydrolase n=1 Tax=Hyphomonas pacifica TaxID=1280941 RepID=UPI000DBFE499|nr:hypothetical protein [Hyphomonas pacifica]RAN37339.1 hypothetical protein HY11_09600 [Hyphomonas pacifica]